MLGLHFPCGAALEQLAVRNTEKFPKVHPTLKGSDCCLSGVENICRRAYENGASKESVSAFVVKFSNLGASTGFPSYAFLSE